MMTALAYTVRDSTTMLRRDIRALAAASRS